MGARLARWRVRDRRGGGGRAASPAVGRRERASPLTVSRDRRSLALVRAAEDTAGVGDARAAAAAATTTTSSRAASCAADVETWGQGGG